MRLEITGRKYNLIFKDDCIEFCEITLVNDKDNEGAKKEKQGKKEYFVNLFSVYDRIVKLSLAKKNASIKTFEDVLKVVNNTNEEFRKIMKL